VETGLKELPFINDALLMLLPKLAVAEEIKEREPHLKTRKGNEVEHQKER
jgi:hypothetical protein